MISIDRGAYSAVKNSHVQASLSILLDIFNITYGSHCVFATVCVKCGRHIGIHPKSQKDLMKIKHNCSEFGKLFILVERISTFNHCIYISTDKWHLVRE